jgi:hypothetical protein
MKGYLSRGLVVKRPLIKDPIEANLLGAEYYAFIVVFIALLSFFDSHSLPLSVVIHIDYQKAPLVIQRFGDVKKLVEQTLDPMVSAYFKNIGQTRTLIHLIQERNEIRQEMSAKPENPTAGSAPVPNPANKP